MSLIIEPVTGFWDNLWTTRELAWAKPAHDLSELNQPQVYLGVRSDTPENALKLSVWPNIIKHLYPQTKVSVLNQSYSKWILKSHPKIDNWVSPKWSKPIPVYDPLSMDITKLKISKSLSPVDLRPHFSLSPKQTAWAKTKSQYQCLPQNTGKPLILLHPWGGLKLPVVYWDKLVSTHSDRYRFWQIGFIGESCVQGCEYYHLVYPIPRNFAKIAAMFSQAQGYVGAPSYGSHLATIFNVPSQIVPLQDKPNAPYDFKELEF